MQKQNSPSGPKLRQAHDTPIRLTGTPGKLVGIVEVKNEGDSHAFIQDFGIVKSALPKVGYGHVPQQLFTYRTIEAGRSSKITLQTAVDTLTPPGEYETTIMIGDTPRRAIFEVKPYQRVRFHPSIVELRGAPGETVAENLVFENHGNVPVTIGMLGIAVLTEVEQVCTSIQRALADTASKVGEGGYETFLNSLVNELARKRVDVVRVRAMREMEIAPGEAEAVPVEFHIPKNAAAGHAYRGKLLMFGQSLGLRLSVTGAGGNKPGNRKKS